MSKTFAAELIWHIAPELRGAFAVQPVLPLEIKLHLERLKLTELIRAASETVTRSAITSQQCCSFGASTAATCFEKLERANGFEPSTLTLAT